MQLTHPFSLSPHKVQSPLTIFPEILCEISKHLSVFKISYLFINKDTCKKIKNFVNDNLKILIENEWKRIIETQQHIQYHIEKLHLSKKSRKFLHKEINFLTSENDTHFLNLKADLIQSTNLETLKKNVIRVRNVIAFNLRVFQPVELIFLRNVQSLPFLLDRAIFNRWLIEECSIRSTYADKSPADQKKLIYKDCGRDFLVDILLRNIKQENLNVNISWAIEAALEMPEEAKRIDLSKIFNTLKTMHIKLDFFTLYSLKDGF
ncbi:MAG: hypothetical protein BGO14_03360 [Chlamydiales bacterium 38-26]|nr:hypothetical protein [Chlamydiales bacterium]OJV09375.1 MAG: hypothetical protein BGO14_03360 [Chlamydiales bacterium 38-26]